MLKIADLKNPPNVGRMGCVISKRALAEIYIFMEILIVQLSLYENLLSNFFGLYFYISTYSRLLYEIIEEDCKCTSGGMGRYPKPGYHGDLYEYTFFYEDSIN